MIERRSRRDMSPQGRKRVAGMVSRDYQTVSGIGGGSHSYQQVSLKFLINIVDFVISLYIFFIISQMYNEEVRCQ